MSKSKWLFPPSTSVLSTGGSTMRVLLLATPQKWPTTQDAYSSHKSKTHSPFRISITFFLSSRCTQLTVSISLTFLFDSSPITLQLELIHSIRNIAFSFSRTAVLGFTAFLFSFTCSERHRKHTNFPREFSSRFLHT